jgi:hypothetical protein
MDGVTRSPYALPAALPSRENSTAGSTLTSMGDSFEGGGAIPNVGPDAVPDSGTPTSFLPAVHADGTAVGGGRVLGLFGRLIGKIRLLFRSGSR